MSAPLCFVDTETDGVHPGRKPWEIALIRRDDEGEREYSFFVEIDLSTADPSGLRVGRFYQRHPRGRVTSGMDKTDFMASCWADATLRGRREAAQIVARMTHGAHLVGAVPNFDAEVFDRLLREHGLCPGWNYHLIDVETLAVGYLRGTHIPVPDRDVITPPWKSDDLMALLGVEPPAADERHTALGDARWAMRAYDAVMGGTA